MSKRHLLFGRRWTTGSGRANDVRAGEEKRHRIYLVDRSSKTKGNCRVPLFPPSPYRPIFAFVFRQFPARQIFAPPTHAAVASQRIEILLLLLHRVSANIERFVERRARLRNERRLAAILERCFCDFRDRLQILFVHFSEENVEKNFFLKRVALFLLSLTDNSCLFDPFIPSTVFIRHPLTY